MMLLPLSLDSNQPHENIPLSSLEANKQNPMISIIGTENLSAMPTQAENILSLKGVLKKKNLENQELQGRLKRQHVTVRQEDAEAMDVEPTLSFEAVELKKDHESFQACEGKELLSQHQLSAGSYFLPNELWRKTFDYLILDRKQIGQIKQVNKLFNRVICSHPVVGLIQALLRPALASRMNLRQDGVSESVNSLNDSTRLFFRHLDPTGSKFTELLNAESFDKQSLLRNLLEKFLHFHPLDLNLMGYMVIPDTYLKNLIANKKQNIEKANALLTHSPSTWTPAEINSIDWQELLNTDTASLKSSLEKAPISQLCQLPLDLDLNLPCRDLVYLVLLKCVSTRHKIQDLTQNLMNGPLKDKITDRDFALKLVEHNGLALALLPKEFQKDREIVLTAIKQNASVIRHVPHELINNPDDLTVIWLAIKQKPIIFRNLPKQIKINQNFVLYYLQHYPENFELIPAQLKRNQQFLKSLRNQQNSQE